MLRGFGRRKAKGTGNNTGGIEGRRATVIRTIEDHIAVLEKREPSRKHRPLSEIKNGKRYIWLLYSQRYIELSEDGSNEAWIDLKQDEVEFWRNFMIPQILTGTYDEGINKVADEIAANSKKTGFGKSKSKPKS